MRTKKDLTDAVQRLGIVPFFKNSVKGFSIEENVDPSVWFADGDGVWEWKGPLIRSIGCAYGKFFENKAAFVSREWFCHLANYRRDGYDFDALYDDGLASRKDKELFELIDANAPVLSKELKLLGGYVKGGKKGFDTVLNRLMYRCYVITDDFVYQVDKKGNTYGWGVAAYTTPERMMGEAFTENVYGVSPGESRMKLVRHIARIAGTDEEKASTFLG